MKRAGWSIIMSVLAIFTVSCEDISIELPGTIEPFEEENPESEYIAIFGDIQYYTNKTYIGLYKHSVDWILAQYKRGTNIACVLHAGDVTQKNEISSWSLFNSATSELANNILYVSMIGDHDYSWDGQFIKDRDLTHFSGFVNYQKTLTCVEAMYEPGRMENIVVRNTIHGERYDILVLEFGPRPEVVVWANQWVSSHPDIKYILMNHEYLEAGGGRRTEGLKCAARLRKCSTFLTPDQLWDSLVKIHNNILCVLCGHVGGLYAVTFEKNNFGRDVPQIQHNIQSAAHRYDNWLMLWDFPAYSDSANVFIYNTKDGQYYHGQSSLFTFKYQY